MALASRVIIRYIIHVSYVVKVTRKAEKELRQHRRISKRLFKTSLMT